MPTLYQDGKKVNGGSNNANHIAYNNRISELQADTLQSAVDEINEKANTVNDKVNGIAYTNPNLLDNPWFTVNQRGAKTYTAVGYTVDRWVINSAKTTVDIGDSGLDISFVTQYTSFAQRLEKERLVNGKTYTFSIMLSDGTIKAKTFTYKDDGNWYNIQTSGETGANGIYSNYRYDTTNSYIIVQIITSSTTAVSISIKAVKLELGTVSTLANDVAPNYQQELAKCQRYCYVYTYNGASYSGYSFSATEVRTNFVLPQIMRTAPTVTISDKTKCEIYTTNGKLIPSEITPSYIANATVIQLINTVSSTTADRPTSQRFNTKIVFSADL